MSDWCVHFSDTLILLVVSFSPVLLHEEFGDISTYRMDYYCGATLDLFDRYQFVVEFEPDNVVLPEYSCDLRFFTRNPGFQMSVRVVAFERGVDCERRLELQETANGSPSTHIICSDNTQMAGPQVFFSKSSELIFKYYYGGPRPGGSFQVVVTLFHKGQCTSDEVRCSNGHCILHELYCNTHKSCGDESESCGDKITSDSNSVTSVILAIVVTVLVLMVVGITLFFCCCRESNCRCRNTATQQTSRFWFEAFTSIGTTEPTGVTNEGANFDDPPDYDTLDPPTSMPLECPPSYNDVIHDTIKYKVSDQTIHYI